MGPIRGPALTEDRRLDLLAVEAFTWTPTLETVCEICLREADSGRRVGFVFLDIENVDQFPHLMGARFGSLMYSAGRKSRLERVRTIENVLRSHGVTVLPRATAPASAKRVSCGDLGIDSIEALREFRPGGAALGMGILSTLVRLSGDSEPEFARYLPLIDRILDSACAGLDLTRELIERWKPETVLLYNGRFALSKAISGAARLCGADVLHHELVSTPDRFFISPQVVHNRQNTRRELRESWAAAGPDREATAAKYFLPARGGVSLFEAQFLGYQKRDQALAGTGRRRVVYFTSSIDEFTYVEDAFENALFPSQQAAAAWLASWAGSRPDVEVVIRMHPRGRAVSVRERNWWSSLAAPNVTVLQAESPVDSYGLASSADRVVTHHSSMGAESTYLGRVSILVGDAGYRGLDCVYEPASIAELAEMLEDNGLAPKPKENCLPFGYQKLTRGEKFRFYEADSFQGGSFFGERVTPDNEQALPARIQMAVLRRLHRLWGLVEARQDRP